MTPEPSFERLFRVGQVTVSIVRETPGDPASGRYGIALGRIGVVAPTPPFFRDHLGDLQNAAEAARIILELIDGDDNLLSVTRRLRRLRLEAIGK